MLRTNACFLLLPLLSLAPLGCSSDSASSSKGAESTAGKTWTRLVEGTWTLGPGDELPRFCAKYTLPRDMYVSDIRPVNPPGTHHTVLSLGTETDDCTSSVLNGVIYASGVGSEGLHLPEGVAMKLPAGRVLNLGLHIYNTSTHDLTGTSGVEVVEMDPKDVKYESEAVLAGPLSISIPPGRQMLSDECSITSDQTVYALFPHMHQLGVHIKTTFTEGGSDKVIHDGAYDFSEQRQLQLDPGEQLHPGDKVKTECTYENTTSKTVSFGESSDTEMCFSILFRYPASGQTFCMSGGGAAGGTKTLPGPACAQPGATGNEIGVGKECTKGGGQCQNNGKAAMCLDDVVMGDFGNFCTLMCGSDADCGTGAKCMGQPGASACIPEACAASLATGDAGAPAGDAG